VLVRVGRSVGIGVESSQETSEVGAVHQGRNLSVSPQSCHPRHGVPMPGTHPHINK
jgi:hypothetical protein